MYMLIIDVEGTLYLSCHLKEKTANFSSWETPDITKSLGSTNKEDIEYYQPKMIKAPENPRDLEPFIIGNCPTELTLFTTEGIEFEYVGAEVTKEIFEKFEPLS